MLLISLTPKIRSEEFFGESWIWARFGGYTFDCKEEILGKNLDQYLNTSSTSTLREENNGPNVICTRGKVLWLQVKQKVVRSIRTVYVCPTCCCHLRASHLHCTRDLKVIADTIDHTNNLHTIRSSYVESLWMTLWYWPESGTAMLLLSQTCLKLTHLTQSSNFRLRISYFLLDFQLRSVIMLTHFLLLNFAIF